jgi:hypothetical protein
MRTALPDQPIHVCAGEMRTDMSAGMTSDSRSGAEIMGVGFRWLSRTKDACSGVACHH